VATFAIVLPLALALVWIGVQVALWAVAAHAATLAATEGAAAAAVDPASGVPTARSALVELAGGLVHDPAVALSEVNGVAEVTVHAGVIDLFPAMDLAVTGRASLPAQVFRGSE